MKIEQYTLNVQDHLLLKEIYMADKNDERPQFQGRCLLPLAPVGV